MAQLSVSCYRDVDAVSTLESRQVEVLVVDNSPENLDSWCNVIGQATGREPHTATTEEGAQEVLENSPIDICVVDLFLSSETEETGDFDKSEGLRLIEACRRKYPHSRIIAITTKLGDSAVGGAEAFRSGADDFISSAWPHVYAEALLQEKVRMFRELLLAEREQ